MSDFHVMSNDDALHIVTAAWRILKRHYEILLGTTVVIIVATFATTKIPYMGYFASIPLVYLSIGQMYVVRQIIDGKPAKFMDMFKVFEDQRLMSALLPLALSGVAIAFVQDGINRVLSDGFFAGFFNFIMSWTLSLVWVALTCFSAPLIGFNGKCFINTIELNLKATTANWLPLLILSGYLLAVFVLTLVCFLLPLFFVGLPVILIAGYLTYTRMFEHKDISALSEQFRETKIG